MKKVIFIVILSIIFLSTLLLKINNYPKTIASSVSPTPTVTPFIIKVSPSKVFLEINQFRSEEDIAPLNWADNLCPFAETRVKEIQTDWSHDGFYKEVGAIFPEYCPTCSKIGENLAVGFYDEETLVNAWVHSPTHYPQLIDPYKNACVKELNNYVVLIVSY